MEDPPVKGTLPGEFDLELDFAIHVFREEGGSEEASSLPILEEPEDEMEEIEDEEESEFGERVFPFLDPPCSASIEINRWSKIALHVWSRPASFVEYTSRHLGHRMELSFILTEFKLVIGNLSELVFPCKFGNTLF